MTYYNETNTCERIKEDGNLCGNKFHDKALREYNKEGNWTGKWICNKCYLKDYHRKPNCGSNIIKSIANRRTGNQNPNSPNAKGDNFEELTCIWRSTISTIPIENLNKKLDNYGTPIDHSRDSELGFIQTKGATYDSYNQVWIQGFKSECDQIAKGFEFDNLILYCTSEDGALIERIYIIPLEEVISRSKIAVIKYQLRKNSDTLYWYEKYRITDKDTIKKVNDIWKEIKCKT